MGLTAVIRGYRFGTLETPGMDLKHALGDSCPLGFGRLQREWKRCWYWFT